MTRMSKKSERRNRMPRRPTLAGEKTGPKKDALRHGYKEHGNGLQGTDLESAAFVAKVK